MKTQQPHPQRSFVALIAIIVFGVQSTSAASTNMVTANQSWLNANEWANNAAPAADNEYLLTTAGTMRTSPKDKPRERPSPRPRLASRSPSGTSRITRAT